MRIRRIILLLLALGVIVGGLWKWNDTRSRAARRLAEWEARQQDQAADNVPLWEQSEVYPVVYPIPQPEIGPVDEDAWIELIRRVGTYRDYREGGPAHLAAVPGAIAVAQTAEGHKAIRGAIDRLSTLPNRPETWTPVPLFPAIDPDTDRVLAALDAPSAIQCVEMPLVEVASFLSKQHGTPIRILPKRLEEAGIPPDTPISKKLDGVTLRSLLKTVLDELELSFLVRDGGLLITTPEDAESRLILVAYPVHDLVGSKGHSAGARALTHLIESTISPQSWDNVGGTGWQSRVFGGWLFVSQTQHVQEQIAEFLTELRSSLANTGPLTATQVRGMREQEAQAFARLESDVAVNFQAMPLRDLGRWLVSQQIPLPVVFNARKLEEAGIALDSTPITTWLPPAPLRTQLTFILEPLELTHVIRDGVIQITTREDAESRLDSVIYDVRPLIHPDAGILTRDELMTLIRSTVDPTSWGHQGGPGWIDEFRGLFVISHVQNVHRRVKQLLERLEQCCLEDDRSWDEIVEVDQTSSVRRLEEKLQTVIDVDYCGMRVGDVLQDLAARHDLPLLLDEDSIEKSWPRIPPAFGYPSAHDPINKSDLPETVLEAPTTLSARQITLENALDRLLLPVGLRAYRREHVLWIAEDDYYPRGETEVRMYNLAKLKKQGQGSSVTLDLIRAYQIVPLDHAGFKGSTAGETLHLIDDTWLVAALQPEDHALLEDWLTEQRTGIKPRRAVEREELQRELETWYAIERDFEAAQLERGASEEAQP